MSPKVSMLFDIAHKSGRIGATMRSSTVKRWEKALAAYSENQVRQAVDRYTAQSEKFPPDFGLMAKCLGKKPTSGQGETKLNRPSWTPSGDWSGDFSGVNSKRFVLIWATMAFLAFRANTERVKEFRALREGPLTIPSEVFDGALAARRKSETDLDRYLDSVFAPKTDRLPL